MTKGIYVIQDTLANVAIGGPMVFPHHAAAVRFFSDVAAETTSVVHRYINDHSLIYLGQFDEQASRITPAADPEVVITGAAWKATQAPDSQP